MRVVLLPSAYLPSLGGVEELTRHLAIGLRAAGDEVEVWAQSPDSGGAEAVEAIDGFTVRRFPLPLPSSRPSSVGPLLGHGIHTLYQMAGVARRFRPDVLHVQCFGPNGIYATALSHLTRIPLVVSLQGETLMDDSDIYEVSSTMRAGLRSAFRRAGAVTACSAFTLADAERRFGLPTGAGRVVFNGVDLAVGTGATGAWAARRDPYVFAVGRLVPKKGFDLLIQAFARTAPRHPEVSLVIGGSGSEQTALRRLGDELGLGDRLQLVGRLDRHEVAEAMAAARAFVVPSRLEPFGIVVLEGWRAGCPVIATSVGGPPEFVTDGKDGLLVDPTRTEELAAAIDRVLTDRDFAESMGQAGQTSVEAFAWPGTAERYRDIYRRLSK